ncbi:MAG: hypothetical protein ACRDMZ_06700, partial [Solirubrobacteraceae bacterium]
LIYAGAGVLLAIVIIVVLSLGGGDDDPGTGTGTGTPTTAETTTNSAVQTTATGDKFEVIAQGTLRPPEGGDRDAKGQVAIVRFPDNNQFRLALQATGLTPSRTRGSAYAVWLFTSDDKKQFLGFPDARVGKDGRLETVSDLSPDTPAYGAVLLTRETADKPTKPGRIVLLARMVTAAELAQQQQQKTQTTTTP